MSATLGIDFGASKTVVASVGRGVIDVILNDISERVTPSLVGFTEQERLIGTAALTQFKSNFRNTCRNMKMMLGRLHCDIEDEQQYSYVPIVESSDGLAGYELKYRGETTVISAISAAATLLSGLKENAEKVLGKPVSEIVISVPSWYADANLRAIQDAAEIADLHCLRFFPEHAASALDYGIFRSGQFHATTPHRVLFVDVGYTSTTAYIADFVQNKLIMVHVEHDKNLGGRNFDHVLSQILTHSVSTKVGQDVASNPRARMKIEDQAVKTKKVLSANQDTTVTLEGIYQDEDHSVFVTREDFANGCKEYCSALAALVQRALRKNGGAEIHSFELVGGCTRIPWVQECLLEVLGNEFGGEPVLSRTLNQDECIAKGCALQAAMLCPRYKVKDFSVVDCVVHPIDIRWDPSAQRISEKNLKGSEVDANMVGGANREFDSQTLVSRGDPYPKTSWITFQPQPALIFGISYSDSNTTPASSRNLASYKLTLPDQKIAKDAKLKICLNINLNRMCVAEAYLVEKEKYQEVGKEKRLIQQSPGAGVPATRVADDATKASPRPDSSAPPVSPAPDAQPQSPSQAQNATPVEGQQEPPTEVPKYEYVDVTHSKTRRRHIPVTQVLAPRAGWISEKTRQELKERELAMLADDRLFRERKEKLNDLESYAYNMKDKIKYSVLGEFFEPEAKCRFLETLDMTSQWVYDEGECAQKSQLSAKLDELKVVGDRALYLLQEKDQRDQVFAQFVGEMRRIRMLAASPDPAYSHINPAKREEIIKKSEDFENWLSNQMALQTARPVYADPVITSQQVMQTMQDFAEESTAILSEPKPASPPQTPDVAPVPAQ